MKKENRLTDLLSRSRGTHQRDTGRGEMKSVLISTRPNWCEKICRKIGEENGIPIYLKPVEVRKSAPKEVPFRAYLYCTNGRFDITDIDDLTSESVRVVSEGRGKVIGEFVCRAVEKYDIDLGGNYYRISDKESIQTCLDQNLLFKYGNGRDLYGWHISDLKIYDKPRELGWFRKPCEYAREDYKCYPDNCARCPGNTVTRPPQSWQYVEGVSL